MNENHYIQPSQPDILEVIANLSSNEVFTPPRVVNAVLDMLPEHVWTDLNLRWLDPGSKTGVFPREITKRLMAGLSKTIKDEQERLNHILTNMIFAIAITDMTAMMTRRSLYCSKNANAEISAASFVAPEGNVWFERTEHSFNDEGRCAECKGTKEKLEKPNRDNYAYAFIHEGGRNKIAEEITMKFDVIVGNPPYQMDIGDTSDVPIYNIFVQQAIDLNPQYLAMIIPSRWMSGGKGLADFRAQMLKDRRIRNLVDYPNARELFPGVEIKGGICYFLWERDNLGDCKTTLVRGESRHGPEKRNLGQHDVFVRDSRALAILDKVLSKKPVSFSEIVSGQTPFGLLTNFRGYRKGVKQTGDLKLFMNEGGSRVEHWVNSDIVKKNVHLINSWKVFVPKAGSDGGQKLPDVVIGKPIVAGRNTVCTQTYLAVGNVSSRPAAESINSYLHTRFARFLISIRKISQDAMKSVYAWVPQQTWDRTWTDAALYKKYGITKEEQEYIESMVKEMPA